jgi:arylesterase/paraoxonase
MLKKLLLSLLIIVLLAGGYFLTIMISTGFFRAIDNLPYGEVLKEIPLAGAEDLTVDYASGLLFISAFDRAGERREEQPTGGIYVMDVNDPELTPIRLDDGLGEGFHPHGIYFLKLDSVRYRLWVVNHQNNTHTIEVFDFIPNDHFAHIKTYADPMIKSPNDVVAINETQFYFTNDHGKTEGLGLIAENYLGLPYANVMYFDGNSFREVANGISYANGITTSPDGKQVLVASPRKFELLVYDVQSDGALILNRKIATGTGIDNLEWDEQGNLWIGAHPNLLRFSAYAKGNKSTAPSEVIVWNPKTDELSTLFLDDGQLVSASTVAIPYKNMLLIGTVMDENLLVLKKN